MYKLIISIMKYLSQHRVK